MEEIIAKIQKAREEIAMHIVIRQNIRSLLHLWIFALEVAKNSAPWTPFGVCRVKNRLIIDFWRFYARGATNC
jgi:hypothetical protein